MIRVYAGNPALTEEVRGWLDDVGFQFYGPGPVNRGMKMLRKCAVGDVLIEVNHSNGNRYMKVVGPEQHEDVVWTLSKWGIKFPRKVGEGE